MSVPLGHTMSDIAAENDSESSLPVFRPFTREELAVIDERIEEKRLKAEKKAERRARNKAVSVESINLLFDWPQTSNLCLCFCPTYCAARIFH